MSQAEAEAHLKTLVAIIAEVFDGGEDLLITHFGRFRHKCRRERVITLPDGVHKAKTGGSRVQFLPSPSLKTRLNGDPEPAGEGAWDLTAGEP